MARLISRTFYNGQWYLEIEDDLFPPIDSTQDKPTSLEDDDTEV